MWIGRRDGGGEIHSGAHHDLLVTHEDMPNAEQQAFLNA